LIIYMGMWVLSYKFVQDAVSTLTVGG